eukprot:8657132-Alexandrium_andersonii.AAC.1
MKHVLGSHGTRHCRSTVDGVSAKGLVDHIAAGWAKVHRAEATSSERCPLVGCPPGEGTSGCPAHETAGTSFLQ